MKSKFSRNPNWPLAALTRSVASKERMPRMPRARTTSAWAGRQPGSAFGASVMS